MAESISEEYKSSLSDLNFNSKPHINMLTMLAEDNIKHASQIVQVIVDHILSVPPESKLPGLYLVDSIIKNVGKQYLALFSQYLVTVFASVFEKVEENTRSLLYKLRQTWTDILPNKILYAVDVRVKKLDPAWPITAKPPAQSIHINPKFLGANAEQKSIPPQTSLLKEKEEMLLKQQQTEVLRQLVVKQQLKILEKQKLELAKLQNPSKDVNIQPIMKMMQKTADPRAVAKLNPQLCRRDPRLLKTNQAPGFGSVPLSASAEIISKAIPSISSTIPSVAVVPTVRKTDSISSVETGKDSLKIDAAKNIRRTVPDVRDLPPIPKKHTTKKKEEESVPVGNEPQEKIKNEKYSSKHSKSIDSPSKHSDEAAKKKSNEEKSKSDNEKSTKSIESFKRKEHSPKSSRKKSTSPDEKHKSTSRVTRSQTKQASQSSKKQYRRRSRSPSEKSETSNSAQSDKEKKIIGDGKAKSNDKSVDEIKRGELASDMDLRPKALQSSDENSRKSVKRDSKACKDDDTKENELEPPEKKPREGKQDTPDGRLNESQNLFGREDQDYRQHSKEQNQSSHKGWAQYKAVHPDEFKSPLRSTRENVQGKMRRQFRRTDEEFYGTEYDRLGRPRLQRGRFSRFGGHRGHPMRGPGGRFDPTHPPNDAFFHDSIASMMLSDPRVMLKQAETRYRLGRLSECDYLDLRRDLQKMLESKQYRRFQDGNFRPQWVDDARGFHNRYMQGQEFFLPIDHRIQGPMIPNAPVRDFKLDGKMRKIFFVDKRALVVMDNDEPYELTFKGEPRKVFIEGLPDPIILGFDGQSVAFEINGKRHIIRFGTPAREIYIDEHPYEGKFGGGAFSAMLDEECVYRIRLEGPPPQVVVGDTPQFELFNKFFNSGQSSQFRPIGGVGQNLEAGIPVSNSSNLPFDVDMRRKAEGVCMPQTMFEENDDMKDVDWRHLEMPNEHHGPPEVWKDRRMMENWKGVSGGCRNIERQNMQNLPEHISQPMYYSEHGPLPPPAWENTLQPPNLPLKLNGSPNATPPHCDRENQYDQRLKWRGKECKEYNHMSNNPQNSPSVNENLPKEIRDNPRMPLLPNAVPRLQPPQFQPMISLDIRQKAPAPQETGLLLPPPLPPFQVEMPPSTQSQPPRALEPPPRFPGLEPPETSAAPVTAAQLLANVTEAGTSSQAQSSDASAPAMPSHSIDVGTLFQKLLAAGIISSQRNKHAQEDNPTTTTTAAATTTTSTTTTTSSTTMDDSKDDEKESEEDEHVPPIEFKSESLKMRHPGAISLLYKGSQCASCGMRFKEMQSEHYSRHLDWHFRMNRREKDGVKKAFSRRWYYEVEDWIQYEEFEDFEERAPSYFELQADGSQVQDTETIEVPSVPASGQETEVCIVCEEPFQLFWVEEEEEWHLRDAVRHDELAYHPACYEDFKKASEASQAADEAATATVKEDGEEAASQEETVTADETQEVKVKQEVIDEDEEMKETVPEVKSEEAKPPSDVESKTEPVEMKEEVVEEILEGKPGEEEIIGVISESEMEVEPEAPIVESKMVVMQSGGIVMKVKAMSIQPQSPSTPASAEKDAPDATEESEEEEFRPPTPDPRYQVLPPVKKGTELSGLCCIM